MKVELPAHPKRKLGQNFLVDLNVIRKIVAFIDPAPTDVIVEIGAGTGALTALVAPRVSRLIAVEFDPDLIPYLACIERVEVVEKDIRKVRIVDLAAGKVRIIGNLPYYISTPILTDLITQRQSISNMILMFQEEVADRITALPSTPEYGYLSVISQYFCRIARGFRITRNCFRPRPEIESRILRFDFHETTRVDEAEFAKFVSAAFSQRRKKLRNNLARIPGVDPEQIVPILAELGIAENTRAEDLSAAQFEQLILRFNLKS
ncbi:MAG TPA: 16S rRNA (adenine(1518)-N(6)/adenine(1519)-N(6))-dimethyltransferase RsmA [Acidobacteriota bacterium]|nr:16S rRNA (adenine(1518)-N(6)/adenine(1519)-N(6))-dimethyltransferase RsmA [Acidobacteriota bacterium]